MASEEAHADVERLMQHMREVEAGLIPADSPPDFVRSDWKPGPGGLPDGSVPTITRPLRPSPPSQSHRARPPVLSTTSLAELVAEAERSDDSEQREFDL